LNFLFFPELVHKVLELVGKSLKLPDVIKLMESNINYILVHWIQQQYALQVPERNYSQLFYVFQMLGYGLIQVIHILRHTGLYL
jgi:hypothetical protein